MAFIDETRFIERLQFFNGQRLFADDLQGLEAFNREMRWLHNQSLHQPGIGSGFAVSGRKGDREVTIQPGYAIDAKGQECVLTEKLIMPIPPVSSEADGKSVFYDLTVSYPDDSDLEEAETREGICQPRGVVRLREAPVFCWVRLQRDAQENLHAKSTKLERDIKNGLKIVLARAEVLNCKLYQDISIAQRRSARPANQPYIACGVAKPTIWKPLKLADPPTSWPTALSISPLGLTADIDTSSAEFSTEPSYWVQQIDGPRVRKGTDYPPIIIDGLISVRDPGPKGFSVDVLLIYDMLLSDTSYPSFDIREEFEPNKFSEWYVVWMGVES